MRNDINKGAGKRQKCLLFELHKQGIISQDKDTGLWMRGALSCRLAKDLLLASDKTIGEQIQEIEPYVLRLEKEAEAIGLKLKGNLRRKLDDLHKQRDNVYI